MREIPPPYTAVSKSLNTKVSKGSAQPQRCEGINMVQCKEEEHTIHD